jgi:hypothetical protein
MVPTTMDSSDKKPTLVNNFAWGDPVGFIVGPIVILGALPWRFYV